MPLEHFKTQVLLLHSQQTTLDVLSAGLGDRYAVHVATSGSEALNTLGATPIHVIVSAQELPGMSGLEALREAKKRSPDTVGILLAGDARDDGLEALVSDQEVFQIVRGAVTPDSLLQLVDQATKRIRMLTLAESANDHAADVDQPAGEHIVMETSEHGAAIVSDGTGRMRALRPHAAQVTSHVGGRDVDVLVLTKDEDFLSTIQDSSRGLHNVHHANTMAQAEALVQNHKVGILVTDAAMAGSGIETIAGRLRSFAPRLVAVVAGRRDDGEMLMDLINRGHVYRFLLKPVSPGRARLAIEASVKHHLEAADSAFRNKTPAGDVPAKLPKAATPATGRPAQKPDAPKTAPAARRAPTVAPAADPSAGTPAPVADRLDDAFGDSGRFTRTLSGITGLAARAGKSIGAASSGANESDTAAESAAASGTAGLRSPRLLAFAVIAVAVLAALGWWLMSPEAPPAEQTAGETGPVETPAPAPRSIQPESTPSVIETDIPQPAGQLSDAALQDPAPAVQPPPYQAVLDQARSARQAGEIVVPARRNAIELYLAASKLAPQDPVIAGELQLTVNDALALAEEALLNQRSAEAANALRLVRLADPQNARLPFLDAQVAQLELRTRLDEARVALRESRFEDAAGALEAAQRAAGADRTEINLLAEELASARSEQRVDEVLALAGQRLAENALTDPANDNARYYYELALSNDADNAAARQGLAMVASKLALRARESIDNGQLDEADRVLQEAAALDANSSDVAASQQALQNARAAQEEAERQAAEAASLAAATQEAGTGTGSSEQAAALSPGDARTQAATGRTPAQPGAEPSTDAGSSSARTAKATQPEFVAISTLQRTNYVAPRYPRVAQRRGITGWVDLSFVVLADGTVTGIEVMNAEPADIFDDSATEAVGDWQFEPPMENGMPVERHVAVRMLFSLE